MLIVNIADGAISFVHHVATGVVTNLAFNPFLHPYAVFFVGLSEISTVPLCIVIAFQRDKGVPLLSERYPTAELIVGIVFSISFIVCRIFLWGFYSYYFWSDCIDILSHSVPHSTGVVIWYLFANASLSLLQLFWLSQILSAIFALFFPKRKEA
jgi:hypothetical protein